MYCSTCGTQLPLGAAVCPTCGTVKSDYVSDSTTLPYDPTQAIIEANGPDQSSQSAIAATRLPKQRISRRNVVLALVGLAVVGTGGGITWLMLSQRSQTSLSQRSQTSSELAKRAAQYSGTWLNDDPNTIDILKLVISNVGQTLTVHGYGACDPTCDWGTRSGMFNGEPFTILFTFSDGSNRRLTMTLNNPEGTKLKVVDLDSSIGSSIINFFHR